MNESVMLILSLSLSGSILALLLFAIKPFIKDRTSKTLRYYLWLVVLVRLVLPVSFETSLINTVFTVFEANGNIVTGSTGANVAAIQQDHAAPRSAGSSLAGATVQKKVEAGFYNKDTDHAAYINDLLVQSQLLLWLAGAVLVLVFHTAGYLRFVKRLKGANTPGTEEDNDLLRKQMGSMHIKRTNLRLYRNRFSATPMLIGLFRPCIVIPDMPFSVKQLEGILRHELTHYRRRDIAVKWFTIIVASLHWFNPFMILIKREMNRACELSCDECVIRDLNEEDRQVYGETLISVVAERKYPAGVLSTTMCEEKKTLKERLAAIMKFRNRTAKTVILSTVIFLVFICAAAALGVRAGVGSGTSGTILPGTGNLSGAATGTFLSSADYNLLEIAKNGTKYIGNSSKDMSLVASLPLPDIFFNQQYISLKTKEKPYGLTAYYEAAGDAGYPGEWPVGTSGSALEVNSKLNAMVLLAMIDNVDDITFAFRDTRSNGGLDQESYDVVFSFSRKDIESVYGSLTTLAGDPDQLAKTIDDAAGKWSTSISEPETQDQIKAKIDKLLSAIMSSPMASSNPGDYIREHQAEYDEIAAMGRSALPYLQSILDSGDRGLRGVIVRKLYSDIENRNKP